MTNAPLALDLAFLDRVAQDEAFQTACLRYAHANGSSHAIAFAVLTAAGAFRTRLALQGAVHALRSYEFGNAAPGLARDVADTAEALLAMAPSTPCEKEHR
ncbi:hypothetical protein ABE438_17605 [Bosea sp. TWI1241]|uniref:hypothetical protein n=1 Tax=Bosea sp. TWI1241 TaxID=3148904 RepID=UPI003209FBD7